MSIKPTNIKALVDSYSISNPIISSLYLKMKEYHSKAQEIEALKELISKLENVGLKTGDLSYFFVNYQIPQISKEFDLLRFGENYNINIELKSNSSEMEIHTQLLQNDYYLSLLEKPTHYFTFESKTGNLYFLNESFELEKVNVSDLSRYISEQIISHVEDINKLFNPSKYLVSPFALDGRFITDKYFLNGSQEDIKRTIQKAGTQFYKVTGKPGTGKSLLIYDLAKEFMRNGKKVSIIHAGQLNSGHDSLIKDYRWNIYPASDLKDAKGCIKNNPDYIIIDEAQRLYIDQFRQVEDFVKASDKRITLIISYDVEQILSQRENLKSLASILEDKEKMGEYTSLKLSKKIRTNPELAKFIQGLFNLKKMVNVTDTEHIALQYFSNYEDALSFAENLDETGWTVINYTPPRYNGDDIEKMVVDKFFGSNAHKVIGQDFEKVVAIIGNDFYYDEDRNLKYRRSKFYSPEKMLYQIVTRARSNLILVIVDNEELLGQILSAINYKEK